MTLGVFIPIAYLYKDVEHYNLTSATPYQSANPTFSSPEEVVIVPTEKTERKFPILEDIPKKKSKDKLRSKYTKVSFVDDKMDIAKETLMEPDKVKTLHEMLDVDVNNASNHFKDIEDKILSDNVSKSDGNDHDTILFNNIYWGDKVEKSLPSGFDSDANEEWDNYVKSSSAIKMEAGCGRMQNRLITFLDGRQACVRYRQNTDQIQGELFSFYLARILGLENLAPSLVSLINLNDTLWQNVVPDIGSAQWNSNRPVVLTKYISNLESANIPNIFKPAERHLNKFDVMNIIKRGGDVPESKIKPGDFLLRKLTESFTDQKTNEIKEDEESDPKVETIKGEVSDGVLKKFVELAQWSDLIVFDYLTANLDRIVNNLYNFQWNVNIMDAPAHNLAKKVDSDLLLFLDNESGLLHGYRLLSKYEIYHMLLLDNLCVFRKSTADAVKRLHEVKNVGDMLDKMFRSRNSPSVLDVLPPLPEKSVKILNERISRVALQIKRCEEQMSR